MTPRFLPCDAFGSGARAPLHFPVLNSLTLTLTLTRTCHTLEEMCCEKHKFSSGREHRCSPFRSGICPSLCYSGFCESQKRALMHPKRHLAGAGVDGEGRPNHDRVVLVNKYLKVRGARHATLALLDTQSSFTLVTSASRAR
eukprot:3066628-Pleurochrysis_carterae.AAC.1